MDIEQLIFPFVMAVLTNSLMIVMIYFLRKIPAFANLFNVWFMVILYLFCLLRIFLPIEFPDLQIIIKDQTVYTWIADSFLVYEDTAHNSPHLNITAWMIIGVWILGTIIMGVRTLVGQKSFKKYLFANGDYATDAERDLFSTTVKEVLKSDNKISLRRTDVISGAVVFGLIQKTVLIPDEDFSEDELRMMFRHECMHIRNKDLWIKLLVQIYCCIFWWNPFAYLLKSDLDLTLEMKCDLSTTKDYSDAQVLTYVETLKKRSVKHKQKLPFIVSSELADGKKKDQLLQRIRKLLSFPPNAAKQIVLQVLVAIVFVSIFAASYLFIWQPDFSKMEMHNEYFELAEDGEVADENNAYLVKLDDGNYLFYFLDFPPEPVSKEEVEQGMYVDFPIYEK